MKIVAITDIHGRYDIAGQIIEIEKPDLVIMGGDLTTVGSIREAETAIGNFRSLCDDILCVAGNMDLPGHDELFVRLGVSLNGRGVMRGGVGFFGASAAPVSPLKTPYELSEKTLGERIEAGYAMVRGAQRKVFVPHAPPYGTRVDIIHTGIHVGSTAVREFIEENSPHVVLCGHIHEARGKDNLGNSAIMNCGPAMNGNYGIIEISEKIELFLRKV